MRRSPSGMMCVLGLAVSLVASPVLVRPTSAAGLFDGNSIDVFGLHVAISGCAVETNGGSFLSCGSTNANAFAEIISQPGPGSAVLIDKNSGGTLFSSTQNTGLDDLIFTLTVTPGAGSTSHTTVTNVITSLAGSASPDNSTNRGRVTDTITHTGLFGFAGGTALDLNTTSATNTFTPETAAFTFSYTENLKLNTQANTGLNLTSLLIRFNPAPEPVSVGIFLVGLAGLSAARRARSRLRNLA
jgi:hypothetical protein